MNHFALHEINEIMHQTKTLVIYGLFNEYNYYTEYMYEVCRGISWLFFALINMYSLNRNCFACASLLIHCGIFMTKTYDSMYLLEY